MIRSHSLLLVCVVLLCGWLIYCRSWKLLAVTLIVVGSGIAITTTKGGGLLEDNRYGAPRFPNPDISLPEMNTWVAQSRPQYSFGPTTDIHAERCAARTGYTPTTSEPLPSNVDTWEPNFMGPGPKCDNSSWLEGLGANIYQSSVESTPELMLPNTCSTGPKLCPLDIHWEGQFKNCPQTWIPAPSCKIYERDDRLWEPNLNSRIQERAMLNGEIWDPYKHFHARQMFAQMLTKDTVHRKDQYMRPISAIQDSYCFAKQKQGMALEDPEIPTSC